MTIQFTSKAYKNARENNNKQFSKKHRWISQIENIFLFRNDKAEGMLEKALQTFFKVNNLIFVD